MSLLMGFAALGLLVGNLIGLTSESVVTQFVGLLFVFIGGSVIALLTKIQASDRRLVGGLLAALCLATLAGVYMGVFVSEYRLLSPVRSAKNTAAATAQACLSTDLKYIRGEVIGVAGTIEAKKALGRLPTEDAYAQMYDVASKCESVLKEAK